MAMSAPAEHVAADHPRITDLVKDVSGLVSPPDVCVRVFELMRASTSSAEDFGEIIGRDPNLTARLLRMVNSSFYGFASRIDTVSRAIAVIGTQELYSPGGNRKFCRLCDRDRISLLGAHPTVLSNPLRGKSRGVQWIDDGRD